MALLEYGGSTEEDDQIVALLRQVYVDGGFTDEAAFYAGYSAVEIKKRGSIILAWSAGTLQGMVICATSANPYSQIAAEYEAEMQLLAVRPEARGKGLGKRLCQACEHKAQAGGYRQLVLSTQPTMSSAHRLYDRLDYRRNPMRDWSRYGRRYLVYEKMFEALATPKR